MKRRLALAFPYIVALIVTGLMLWDGQRRDMTQTTVDHEATNAPTGDASETGVHRDVVCHMDVGEQIGTRLNGVSYYFCSTHCRERFLGDTERFLVDACLVCRLNGAHTPLDESGAFEATWQGQTYAFCSEKHRREFREDPAGYFMHSMWGIPGWLYYVSVGFVLVLSFGVFELRAGRSSSALVAAPAPLAGADPIAPPAKAMDARHDLLRNRLLQRIIAHPLTRFAFRLPVVILFLVIIFAGLFGNQLPSRNIAPLLTWTVWWGGLILLIAYLGKAWCYVCPWDAIAEWAERLRFWGRGRDGLGLGLKWPHWMRNIWPATILFIGLTWIELGFGVTMSPRATAWLALAMLGLAFVSVFLFDRKSFCRYGCLVGRISGLYALFSPVEVRAADHEVCRSCKTHSCYKGNDCGDACPTFEHLATMDQNTYCISCMECVKTCETGNVALRMRPWGADLVGKHRARSDEAYLALLMLSLTGFHGLTMTRVWKQIAGWIGGTLGLGDTVAFSIGMAAVMIAPGLLYALLVGLSWWMSRTTTVSYRDYFIRYAYALLPIALFYHLAHNSEHLLMEGQKVLALMSDPFGYQWNLFGTAEWSVQPLISLSTLWIIQILFVLTGHIYSLWTARRAAGALFGDNRIAFRSQLPMLAAMILFSVMSLWLLKQPMEMRTSAM